jgi:uncharacterized protein with HEPN domain
MRDIDERLRDIREAIMNIYQYTSQGRHEFDESPLIRTWVIRHLEIIGEAVRNLPQDLKNEHPEIPWRQISGMRDMLIHKYFIIDPEIVWTVVERDLPGLKAVIDMRLNVGDTTS